MLGICLHKRDNCRKVFWKAFQARNLLVIHFACMYRQNLLFSVSVITSKSFLCRFVKNRVSCCCVKLSVVALSTCSASGSQKCQWASLSAQSVPQVRYWMGGQGSLLPCSAPAAWSTLNECETIRSVAVTWMVAYSVLLSVFQNYSLFCSLITVLLCCL